MTKIRRIHDFQHSFSFSSQEEQFDAFYARFLEGDLGKIYMAVPWDDLVASFRLKEAKKGPSSIFSPQGKLALMFLKNYSGLSDRKLIEHLNGNLDWQFFCDIYLGTQRLSNFKIISEVRCELAGKLDMDGAQEALYGHWSPYIGIRPTKYILTCTGLLSSFVPWMHKKEEGPCSAWWPIGSAAASR